MNTELRSYQKEFKQVCKNLLKGHTKDVLIHVAPGGGKSYIPRIAAEELFPDFADFICWITPNHFLKNQGAEILNFPVRKRVPKDSYQFDSVQGMVICYDSLNFSNNLKRLEEVFKEKKVILVLDEFHHCYEGSDWTIRLLELKKLVKLTILMTGTIERHDGRRILDLDYVRNDGKLYLDTSRFYYIARSYIENLEEESVIPMSLKLYSWESEYNKNGSDQSTDNESDTFREGIYTALKTEFSEHLLREGLIHYQTESDNSKCLIISADVSTAEEYKDFIQEEFPNLSVGIATYKHRDSYEVIEEFRSDGLQVLVTVAMAYEGLDVPNIGTIINLTHIRSVPWIVQCFSRGNRVVKGIPYSNQEFTVFSPDDELIRRAIRSFYKNSSSSLSLRDREKYQSYESILMPKNRRSTIPIGSNLVELTNTYKVNVYRDWEMLRSEYENFDGTVAEFCRMRGISISLGQKHLKGLNSRKLVDKERLIKIWKDLVSKGEELSIQEFKEKYNIPFHTSTINRVLRPYKSSIKKYDWNVIFKRYKDSGLSGRDFCNKFKEEYGFHPDYARKELRRVKKKLEKEIS